MLILPEPIMTLLIPFKPLFRQPTWVKAQVQVLFIGAILATGKRTVTAALRVMGLSQEPHFANYHQVLNRAVWSPRQLSEMLLTLLMKYLDSDETKPLVFGIDETIERRWGAQIAKRGIYRDAVRSSKSHFVKTSGLRWISLMWLTEISWAERVWALPFLTVLAPSERYHAQAGVTIFFTGIIAIRAIQYASTRVNSSDNLLLILLLILINIGSNSSES